MNVSTKFVDVNSIKRFQVTFVKFNPFFKMAKKWLQNCFVYLDENVGHYLTAVFWKASNSSIGNFPMANK